MPRCKRCGEKYWAMELDDNGRCKSCAQKAADQNARTLCNNYDLCREGKASSSVQRIYDAFIRKYPDALITGISVKDDGNKLLLYLDGQPMYYATLDPLTNSADLVKYVPNKQTSSVPSSSSRESRESRDYLLIFCGFILAAIAIVGLLSSSAPSSSSSSNIAISTRHTSTSRPTSTPSFDDPVRCGEYYANRYMPDAMTLDTVEISESVGETYLVIACNMDKMWDGDDYIRSAAELICNVGPGLLSVSGYDYVTFLFYGPFIDKYGNRSQSLGIRAMYDFEDLQKVNFEHFSDTLYSNPSGVIKVTNNYMIHPAYTR